VDTGSRKENASNKPTQMMKVDQSPIFFGGVDDADRRIGRAEGPEFLGVGDEHVGVDDRLVGIALYKPSIQVSTILISSGLPSMNCLQVMVERSSTTAWAGTDGSTKAAPARFQGNVVNKT
jgi:hypothetical protein